MEACIKCGFDGLALSGGTTTVNTSNHLCFPVVVHHQVLALLPVRGHALYAAMRSVIDFLNTTESKESEEHCGMATDSTIVTTLACMDSAPNYMDMFFLAGSDAMRRDVVDYLIPRLVSILGDDPQVRDVLMAFGILSGFFSFIEASDPEHPLTVLDEESELESLTMCCESDRVVIKVNDKTKVVSMQAQMVGEAVGDCCTLGRSCEHGLVVKEFINLLRQGRMEYKFVHAESFEEQDV